MTFLGYFLVGDSASSAPGELTYQIRLPWYRSLPLSSIVRFAVALDGREVPAASIRLELDGVVYALDEFAALWDRYWFVQDRATVIVTDQAADAPALDVTTTLELRSPYIMTAPGVPLVTHASVTSRFEPTRSAA